MNKFKCDDRVKYPNVQGLGTVIKIFNKSGIENYIVIRWDNGIISQHLDTSSTNLMVDTQGNRDFKLNKILNGRR
jgi:hypothetical protein